MICWPGFLFFISQMSGFLQDADESNLHDMSSVIESFQKKNSVGSMGSSAATTGTTSMMTAGTTTGNHNMVSSSHIDRAVIIKHCYECCASVTVANVVISFKAASTLEHARVLCSPPTRIRTLYSSHPTECAQVCTRIIVIFDVCERLPVRVLRYCFKPYRVDGERKMKRWHYTYEYIRRNRFTQISLVPNK